MNDTKDDTTFGGFNPFPSDDSADQGGPKAAISAEDGTQHAPTSGDAAIPPYDPNAQPQPNQPDNQYNEAPASQALPQTTTSEQYNPLAGDDALTTPPPQETQASESELSPQEVEGLLEENTAENAPFLSEQAPQETTQPEAPQPDESAGHSPFAAQSQDETAQTPFGETPEPLTTQEAPEPPTEPAPPENFSIPSADSLSLADPGADMSAGMTTGGGEEAETQSTEEESDNQSFAMPSPEPEAQDNQENDDDVPQPPIHADAESPVPEHTTGPAVAEEEPTEIKPESQAEPEQPEGQAEQSELPPLPAGAEPLSPMPESEGTSAAAASSGNSRKEFTPHEIQHIVQEHYNWLNSEGREGKRANFRGGQLQGVDLSGSVLVEASLRGADLSNANLSQVDLRGADLSEATLQQTNLTYSNLSAAVLTRADLRTTQMEGSVFEGTDFSSAGLIGANMAGLHLASANFLEADLQSADLSGANLTGASMRDTNCYYANFTGANLSQAQCRNTNFEHAILENAQFEGANLKGARLENANLNGVDLNQAAETSPEQKEGSLNAEKQQLGEQQAQLEKQQASLKQREDALSQQQNLVDKREREIMRRTHGVEMFTSTVHDVMARQKKTQSKLRMLSLLWLVLGLLIIGGVVSMILMLDFAELNILEISIVCIIAVLIIILALATLISASKSASGLNRIRSTYEETMGREMGHPHTEAEATASLPGHGNPQDSGRQPVPPPIGEAP